MGAATEQKCKNILYCHMYDKRVKNVTPTVILSIVLITDDSVNLVFSSQSTGCVTFR